MTGQSREAGYMWSLLCSSIERQHSSAACTCRSPPPITQQPTHTLHIHTPHGRVCCPTAASRLVTWLRARSRCWPLPTSRLWQQ